jgi:hypothetical protein
VIEDLIYDIQLNELIINKDRYINLDHFSKPTFYDTEEFHLYHRKFVSDVYRVIVKDNNKYLGYCYVGVNEGIVKAPYSSPFAIIYIKNKYKVRDVCQFIKGLIECTKSLNCQKIEFTLAPEIYSPELINSLIPGFFSEGFTVRTIDINNYYDLTDYTSKEFYLDNLIHSTRKSYKKALSYGLEFLEIQKEDFRVAYNVIKINREEMGYPLKISDLQMEDLINMNSLNCRCFIVKREDNIMASAIIFDVTDDISQVVYWGDISKYRKMSSMSILVTEIFSYYSEIEKKYLDIGPSSENGIINVGLADFKKSIGCNNNIKIKLDYELQSKINIV